MNCELFEVMILERTSGELSPQGQATLAEHLPGCADCSRFAAELALMSPAMLSPADLRAGLAPADPGEAFFVRVRNEVWHAVDSARAAARVPTPVEPTGFGARVRWALRRLSEVLLLQRHALATTAVAVATVAALTVALWPRDVRPPSIFLRDEPSIPAPSSSDTTTDDNNEGDVLAEVGSLSREEMQTLSTRLTIETSADVNSVEVEDDTEGVEGQLDSLSQDELKALDVQIVLATREAKGA